MEFYFLDRSKFGLTEYSYQDFDSIISKFGYEQAGDESIHKYFNWTKVNHWSFLYEPYSETELAKLFRQTEVFKESVFFIIRILHHMPLIKVNALNLAEMLDDLSYESGMGWEAISICGKYIMEFTDGYEYLAISNFEMAGAV